MPEEEPGFTAEQLVAAQRSLRHSLNLEEETFPLPIFVGMISDEIELLRAAGKSDAEMAATITAATGRSIDHADLAKYYASPAQRQRG